jgi:hypothetical protein
MREYDGYATDSPIPRMSRARSRGTKPCTKAAAAVAADHMPSPAPSSHFTSTRSASQPDTS